MIIHSLGAGVQSSCIEQMSIVGELPPPDASIFADTGVEPKKVHEHLDYLESLIDGRWPIYRVSAGNLEEDLLNALHTGKRTGTPPLFVKSNAPTEKYPSPIRGGVLWRQCTQDYKLVPLRRKTRELYLTSGKEQVRQVIGISLDEFDRMRDSGVKYITNEYPLVEMRMTRNDCAKWSADHGFKPAPKSACRWCPYKSNARWIQMKHEEPEEFALAVEFDRKLREGKLPGVTGDAYVHRSFIPLSEVDLRNDEDRGQGIFDFTEECTGMCGV